MFEVRLKINKAYKFPRSSEHGRDEAQEMSRDAASKCVRFWKDVYRQPKTGDDLRFDHGFFLRFKNPSDAHHILVYLKFDLVVRMIDRCPPLSLRHSYKIIRHRFFYRIKPVFRDTHKSNEYTVHTLNLDFETRPSKTRRRERAVAVRRKTGNDADDEELTRDERGQILKG